MFGIFGRWASSILLVSVCLVTLVVYLDSSLDASLNSLAVTLRATSDLKEILLSVVFVTLI